MEVVCPVCGAHFEPPSAESFAETGYARRRRWKPGHFSFNTREGQCPTCRGLGHIDLDVQYLPDITVGCPTCHGARFSDATLAVQVDGLTIADVLGLSVREALERFDIPAADGSVASVAASRKAGIPASQA